MNAAVAPAPSPVAAATAPAPARIALLGTGTGGRAVLERLATWEATPGTAPAAALSLVHVTNSRTWFRPDDCASARLRASRRAVAGPAASLDDLPSRLGGGSFIVSGVCTIRVSPKRVIHPGSATKGSISSTR